MTLKPLYFHLIYISLIAILGFKVWLKQADLNTSIQSLNFAMNQMNDDASKIDSLCIPFMARAFKNTESTFYYSAGNVFYYKKTTRIKQLTDSILTQIEKQIKTPNFDEIGKLDNQLNRFCDSLRNIGGRQDDLLALEKKYLIPTYLGSNKLLKLKNKSTLEVSAELILLRNKVLTDYIIFLNYCLDQSAGVMYCGIDPNRLSILPNSPTIFEGEKYTCDITFAKYISSMNKFVATVNGKRINSIDGMVHVRLPNQTKGVKNLNIGVVLFDPITEDSTQLYASFKYPVLPKCSLDCH